MEFANPLAAFALATFIPLIILYFIKPKPRELKIPSLVLIFQLERKEDVFRSVLRRFVRDPLLLIQLITIALLTLAMLNPFFPALAEVEAEDVVLVIDASGSMQATDVGQSRFEEAVGLARGVVGGKDRVSIILAENVPIVVLRDGDGEKARNLLATLRPRATPTNLGDAILLGKDLLAGKENKRIIVYSDFARGYGPEPALASKLAGAEGVEVDFIQVGREGGNVGIVDIKRTREGYSVAVRSYAQGEEEVTLQLSSKDKVLSSETRSVRPSSREVFLLQNLPGGLLTIDLRHDDPLPLDNRAYLAVPEPKEERVLLISEVEDPYIKYALASAKSLKWQVAVPPVIPPFENFDIVILGEVRSTSLLPGTIESLATYAEKGGNVVIVASDKLQELGGLDPILPVALQGGSGRGKMEVRTVNELTLDLDLQGVTTKYLLAEAREGSITLATAGIDGSPVLAVWSKGKGKVAYFGIKPERSWSDFHLSPSFPIFWVRLTDWMRGTNLVENKNFATGDLVPLGERVEVKTPTGMVTTDRLLLDETGVYEFKGDSIASNLLDERESDIAPGSTVPKEEVKGTVERRSVEVRRYIEDYILVMAAALILGELLFLRRRGEL
ncbi:MAG: BatA domain-containing protein [Euryarchaeota archaeon]|nr:BatA domain-containing protein [Euryarchaeota archaeon]